MKYLFAAGRVNHRQILVVNLLIMLVTAMTLSGCGGTKVYDTTKTIVYKGQIYQVTNVQHISSKTEGSLDDKSTVNMANMDKKAVEKLIDENQNLFVRMSFGLDGTELVYVAQNVDSYRTYSQMQSAFERAGKDIAKLMREKKTAQLKLR